MIGTRAITEAELREFAKDRLIRLQIEEYNIKRSVLDDLISLRLIQAEAAARGISVPALQVEVEKDVEPVTEEQKRVIYESNPSQFRGQSEALALSAIEANLRRSRLSAARTRFIGLLRTKNPVVLLLDPIRLEVSRSGAPTRGHPEAPITLVAFSDFQCPHCARLGRTLEQLMTRYKEKIRVEFRDFPVLRPFSNKAAEAGRCAAEQGRFWELHDAMFADQKSLDVPALKRLAEGVGIEGASFVSCLDSGRNEAAVTKDIEDGRKFGVTATPAIFVNGRPVPGGANPETIGRAIEEELALLSRKGRVAGRGTEGR